MERIGVILLAAGGSARMGRPKQLLPFGGTSLLRHAAGAVAASGLRPAVAVLGANSDRTAAELADLPLTAVVNAAWERGIGSSIRAGVAAALTADPQLGAVAITLADLPAVTAELLAELARVRRERGSAVVACRYGGAAGVPALFAATLFPELLGLPDESGAKRLIAAAGPDLATVEFPGGAADIDTPADYETLRPARTTPDTSFPGRV